MDGIEGCPPSFLVPGFHDGLGDLAACRQGEGRSQEKFLLLVLSPPLPASLTRSTRPKQRSCKPAFVGSEEHSIWAEKYFFSPSLKYLGLFLLMGGKVSENESEAQASTSSILAKQVWRFHGPFCLTQALVL